jgi:methylmalonyl-CoA mutase N-terminal domain/subunit
MAEIDKIMAMGGALRAIESGYFQRALGREQYQRNKDLEEGRRKWVGVNHLVHPGEKRQIEIFRADNSMEDEQVARVRALRARRDNARVAAALEAVREAARGGSNLVPPCLAAVKVYATHGELCDALRDVFGVHTPDSQLTGV